MKAFLRGILSIGVFLLCMGTSEGPGRTGPKQMPGGERWQRGMCVLDDGFGYDTPEAWKIYEELQGLNVEWVSLTPFAYQPDLERPEILFSEGPHTHLRRAIGRIHALGMKVMLKPHITSHLFFTEGKWRGDIRMRRREEWEAWFEEYTAFIRNYAALAEACGVEVFCVGVEYAAATRYEEGWRRVIEEVRRVYSGRLTYAAHHEEYRHIRFWDALDYIGVNAYFDLEGSAGSRAFDLLARWGPARRLLDMIGDAGAGAGFNADGKKRRVEKLVGRWRPALEEMERIHWKFRKPIIFTEAGFKSAPGAADRPWQWEADGAPVRLEEQAACYEALFRAVWDKDWLCGLYWWKYATAPGHGGPSDAGFTPRNKPAAKVVSAYYGQQKGCKQEVRAAIGME